jgi:uncharacterized protein (TIGR02453 family)
MKLLAKELEVYINELNKDLPCVSTISRLNRDVRFSKNKNPYKESSWLTLKPIDEDWKNRPVYFFELKATGYMYGMGYYSAEPATMTRFRKYVDEKPQELEKVIKLFSNQTAFSLEGDKYKKKFNVDYNEAIMNWYCRKSIDLISFHDIDELIFTPEIVDIVKKDFAAINEIYRYMWQLHR